MSRVLVFPGDLMEHECGAVLRDPAFVTVRTEAQAAQALVTAQVWRPELILFSSNLAGDIGAIEFCARVRQEPALAGTRLVMLTDFIGPSLDPAYGAEVDAHLVSPVSATQLTAVLRLLLSDGDRLARKIPMQVLVRLEGLSPDPSLEATTLANMIHLSDSGMRLESQAYLALGKQGMAHFYLPGTPNRVSLACTVDVLIDEVLLHYAVTFTATDETTQRVISQFIARTAASD